MNICLNPIVLELLSAVKKLTWDLIYKVNKSVRLNVIKLMKKIKRAEI